MVSFYGNISKGNYQLVTKGTFHAKIGTIKDRNGMELTEAKDTKKRWHCIIIRDLIYVIAEWSSGFPYFLQFLSEFGNKEFMV